MMTVVTMMMTVMMIVKNNEGFEMSCHGRFLATVVGAAGVR